MNIVEEAEKIVAAAFPTLTLEELIARLEDLSSFLYMRNSRFLDFCAEMDFGIVVDYAKAFDEFLDVLSRLRDMGYSERARPILDGLRTRLQDVEGENAFFVPYMT